LPSEALAKEGDTEKNKSISLFLCDLCALCVENSSALAKKFTVSSAEIAEDGMRKKKQ